MRTGQVVEDGSSVEWSPSGNVVSGVRRQSVRTPLRSAQLWRMPRILQAEHPQVVNISFVHIRSTGQTTGTVKQSFNLVKESLIIRMPIQRIGFKWSPSIECELRAIQSNGIDFTGIWITFARNRISASWMLAAGINAKPVDSGAVWKLTWKETVISLLAWLYNSTTL